MVEKFLKAYAELVADYPDKISLETVDIDEFNGEIIIYADRADTGKLIGREGRMINAIKVVISAYKSKGAKNYRVTVKPVEA